MKKKLPILALALVFVLALAACGDADISGKVAGPSVPAAGESTPAPNASSETELQFGDVEGGVYENAYLGIGCKLDETWTYYGQDMLDEINGMVTDSIDDDEIRKLMEEGSAYYDMYAASEEELSTINIVFENMGLNLNTEEAFVDGSLELMAKTLESAGMTAVQVEKAKLSFAGKERFAFSVYAEVEGTPVYQKGIVIKKGRYLASITLASFQEDKTDSLLELFYPLG